MNKTTIEWTDYTANPIRAKRISDGKRGHACVMVSPGCDHCYSESWNRRFGTGLGYTPAETAQTRTVFDAKELARMCSPKVRGRVFVGDMVDLFRLATTRIAMPNVIAYSVVGRIWQAMIRSRQEIAGQEEKVFQILI